MLNKKKEQRPLVTDLIDFFKEKQVQHSLHIDRDLQLSELDKQNYIEFKTE